MTEATEDADAGRATAAAPVTAPAWRATTPATATTAAWDPFEWRIVWLDWDDENDIMQEVQNTLFLFFEKLNQHTLSKTFINKSHTSSFS